MTAQTKNTKINKKGFTLIELLVVIGILAILLAITLIAINPARQFQQARNTQRQSDANAILNAIHQFLAENGNLPTNMPAPGAAAVNIASTGAGGEVGDLCDDLVTTYIAELPVDPSSGIDPVDEAGCAAAYDTEYQVSVSAGEDNRVTITVPNTEPAGDPLITVTR
jgi:prepilin-type N-terminal cleavage/methylation domain-containing protein